MTAPNVDNDQMELVYSIEKAIIYTNSHSSLDAFDRYSIPKVKDLKIREELFRKVRNKHIQIDREWDNDYHPEFTAEYLAFPDYRTWLTRRLAS